MRHIRPSLLLSVFVLASCASTPPPQASTPMASASRAGSMPGAAPAGVPRQRAPATPPYFDGDTSDFFLIMPPAPSSGDARDESDRRIFRQTRALEGSPRWQMAADDAELGTAPMLRHFACSLGVEATPEQLPRTVALLQKATREAARSVGPAKEHYARKRPFLVDQGPTCVAASTIGESFDYPSGHTSAGWAWALVLAQVDPEHAMPILKRGRAIGDSRVVCGMHNPSAVDSSRLLTGAAMTVISASPRYQADVVRARAELVALRERTGTKPQPERCALEAQLVEAYW